MTSMLKGRTGEGGGRGDGGGREGEKKGERKRERERGSEGLEMRDGGKEEGKE